MADQPEFFIDRSLGRKAVLVRGGIEQAAKALAVTRFSIYNYLEEIRGDAKARSANDD
jgi:hypothetical protein